MLMEIVSLLRVVDKAKSGQAITVYVKQIMRELLLITALLYVNKATREITKEYAYQ